MKRLKNWLILLAVLACTAGRTLSAGAQETGPAVLEEVVVEEADRTAQAGQTAQTAGEPLPVEITWEGADNLCVPKPASGHLLTAQGSKAAFNGCFGNQLSGAARELYDGLVAYYVRSRKADSFLYTFRQRPSCTYKGKKEAYAQTAAYRNMLEKLYKAAQAATDAFAYDYPEVFWIRGWSYGPRNLSITGKSSKYTIHVKQFLFAPKPIDQYASGLFGTLSAFDANVKAAVQIIKSIPGANNSRFQLVKAIHDCLCEWVSYSEQDGMLAHSAGGVFAGYGRVVCEGYAKAFKVLCDRLKIPCVCIGGVAAGELHMWNYVQMSDLRWYLVDVTWDDPDRAYVIDYDYFLAGSSGTGFFRIPISAERVENGYFSTPEVVCFSYPALNQSTYVWLCSSGHVPVADPAVAPTCTREGETAGTHCSRCKDVLSGHEKIKALGHSWGKWTVTSPATIQNRGMEVRVCARDKKHIEKRAIAKEAWTIKKTPSGVKAKAKKNQVKVSWKKLKGKSRKYLKKISAIQVQYASDRSFRDAVTKTLSKKKTKTTITLPKKKKVYYVRVRYTGSGGVSKWSKVKKVSVK